MALITLGLSQIEAAPAEASGEMPAEMTKIGKTYKDTCKLAQDNSDVTEHHEEGKSAPEVRSKEKKIPVLTFSVMDPDVEFLVDYIGGEKVETTKWGFNGDEIVEDKAIRVKSEQGLWVDIPRGDIDAVIDADFSAKGIFLVNFTVTPMAVPEGKKAILSYPAP